MNKIEFLENPKIYFNTTEFIAEIPKVNSEDELFEILNESLKFPDYFESNWNALFDCLRDFHWIEEKGIVLVHDGIPLLDKATLKIYVEILIDAAQDWKNGEDHYLKIIFPKESKLFIEDFLNER